MSAIELLTKAIELDVSGRRIEALKLYEDGIAELLRICKGTVNFKSLLIIIRHFNGLLLDKTIFC